MAAAGRTGENGLVLLAGTALSSVYAWYAVWVAAAAGVLTGAGAALTASEARWELLAALLLS